MCSLVLSYKRITNTISEIHYDSEKVGYIELVGDMYCIEVYYMPFELAKTDKRLIKGIIKRLVKWKKSNEYKQTVKRYELRNSKLYGKKYVEFQILD